MQPITYFGRTKVQERLSDGNPYTYTYKVYDIKDSYGQKRPFNLVLPYYRFRGEILTWDKGADYGSWMWDADAPPSNPDLTSVKNRSYERLRGKLYDRTGLGVDFVEYRQSISMIASTGVTLARAAWAIKSFNFLKAAQILRMKILPKGVSAKKSFANNWLEFHFGWSPLIKDIHESLMILDNPLKSLSFTNAKVKDPITWSYYFDYGSGVGTGASSGFVYAKQGAVVRALTNTTAHSLDQFGLSNPASLLWEVVPFSFVVDWFVNVGDYLAQFNDFAGMTLDSTYCTSGYKWDVFGAYRIKPGYGSGKPRLWTTRYISMTRATSLSGISLEVKRVGLPSISRAATAISLVVQQLGRR